MGMFDYVRCKYPLPVDGANARLYQSKSLPSMGLDTYEIREDGSLWHEEYDTEDRSDPNAEGILALRGMLTKVNKRWVRVQETREVRFYDLIQGPNIEYGWVEFSAYFVDGQIKELHLVEHRDPQ